MGTDVESRIRPVNAKWVIYLETIRKSSPFLEYSFSFRKKGSRILLCFEIDPTTICDWKMTRVTVHAFDM